MGGCLFAHGLIVSKTVQSQDRARAGVWERETAGPHVDRRNAEGMTVSGLTT